MGMQSKVSAPDGDDDEFAWARQYTMPEEYVRHHCHPIAWNGYWRWFISPNVIDLVRIRRQRQKQQLDRTISKNRDC